MRKCNLCNTSKCPKHEVLSILEKDKFRLLNASKKNKLYYYKIVKWLLTACAILTAELILTLAFGKDGILLLINIILKVIK